MTVFFQESFPGRGLYFSMGVLVFNWEGALFSSRGAPHGGGITNMGNPGGYNEKLTYQQQGKNNEKTGKNQKKKQYYIMV